MANAAAAADNAALATFDEGPYDRSMAARPSQLDELLRMPAPARSAAAEELLRSLEEAEAEDADPRAAWAAELETRVAQPTPGVPAETVLDEGRRRVRERR